MNLEMTSTVLLLITFIYVCKNMKKVGKIYFLYCIAGLLIGDGDLGWDKKNRIITTCAKKIISSIT